MILEVLIISIIAGWVRKGELQNLKNIDFKGLFFIVLGIILNSFLLYFIGNSNSNLSNILYNYLNVFQFFTLFLVIIGLLFNYKESSFVITSFGIFLNLIPITLNQGKMPVAKWALQAVGLDEIIIKVQQNVVVDRILITAETNLNFLGDIIPIEYPFPKVISLGDIAISIGIFLIIQKYMTLPKPLQD